MWNFVKDLWLLFGRMFNFPTKPGLRRIGNPDKSSPVFVTCNFELTVRKVIKTLKKDNIDAWLLVASTKGTNVWCAASGGYFNADTVISIIKTSGIEKKVDHRKLILPQLSATGVNIWELQKRTSWKPYFGPVDIKDLAAYLRSGKTETEPWQRQVKFNLKDRIVMGTNLGFSSLLFFILPLLFLSIWFSGLWWKSVILIFFLAVFNSMLVFWLPGKLGVQKGISLGLIASALFVIFSQTVWKMGTWNIISWSGWIIFLAAYLGYDMPGWSPLWRTDFKELIFGKKRTLIEIKPERCIACGLCQNVCPVDVFKWDLKTKKSMVANLDACQACGACIENCPTMAIESNFRAGVCSCPTCTVINTAKSLNSPVHDQGKCK